MRADIHELVRAATGGNLERIAAVAERNDELIELAMTLSLMAGKLRDNIAEIRQAQGRIDDLRALARRPELRRSKTDINALTGEQMSAYPAREGISFEKNFSSGPLYAEIDAEQIGRALRELFDNAVEAMPEGGKIVVSTSRLDDGRAMITVTDRGVGIGKELFAKIFEPFYTTKPRAAGMGLPVAEMIVRAHEGELSVESWEGRGSTFIIAVPS